MVLPSAALSAGTSADAAARSAGLDGADGEEGAGGEQAGADDEKDGTHVLISES